MFNTFTKRITNPNLPTVDLIELTTLASTYNKTYHTYVTNLQLLEACKNSIQNTINLHQHIPERITSAQILNATEVVCLDVYTNLDEFLNIGLTFANAIHTRCKNMFTLGRKYISDSLYIDTQNDQYKHLLESLYIKKPIKYEMLCILLSATTDIISQLDTKTTIPNIQDIFSNIFLSVYNTNCIIPYSQISYLSDIVNSKSLNTAATMLGINDTTYMTYDSILQHTTKNEHEHYFSKLDYTPAKIVQLQVDSSTTLMNHISELSGVLITIQQIYKKCDIFSSEMVGVMETKTLQEKIIIYNDLVVLAEFTYNLYKYIMLYISSVVVNEEILGYIKMLSHSLILFKEDLSL